MTQKGRSVSTTTIIIFSIQQHFTIDGIKALLNSQCSGISVYLNIKYIQVHIDLSPFAA